jgi:hypothetical protein
MKRFLAEVWCHLAMLWAGVRQRPCPGHRPGCGPEHRAFWAESPYGPREGTPDA